MPSENLCPCQSALPYSECCAPFHQGKFAPNAQSLMRSRYSAYVLQFIDYIIETTVPSQQAYLKRADLLSWARQTQWLGLEVLQYLPQATKHHALVEFKAYFAENGVKQAHHELSAFVQRQNRWYFIDPTVPLPSMKSPCVCGSGRKFKQCCGQFLH